MRLWSGCLKQKSFSERVFQLQKEAVGVISKLSFRQSCINEFGEFKVLTYHTSTFQKCPSTAEPRQNNLRHGHLLLRNER